MLENDPTAKFNFSGKGHFLHGDYFVLCTTDGMFNYFYYMRRCLTYVYVEGKIYIWRRDRDYPVHILGDLTADKDRPLQIACNHASEDYMFATRSRDGTVRIWKAQDAARAPLEESTRGPFTDSPGHNILGIATRDSPSPQMVHPELLHETKTHGEASNTS